MRQDLSLFSSLLQLPQLIDLPRPLRLLSRCPGASDCVVHDSLDRRVMITEPIAESSKVLLQQQVKATRLDVELFALHRSADEQIFHELWTSDHHLLTQVHCEIAQFAAIRDKELPQAETPVCAIDIDSDSWIGVHLSRTCIE